MGLSFGGVDFTIPRMYQRPEYWREFSQGDESLLRKDYSIIDLKLSDKIKLDDSFKAYEYAAQNIIEAWRAKKHRDKKHRDVLASQKIKRSWIFHRDYSAFRQKKASIVLSQAVVRKAIASSNFNKNIVAVKKIQTKVRAKVARENYLKSLKAATDIQRIVKKSL